MRGLVLFGILFLISCSCEKISDDQVIDIDGNIYGTVKIGTQVWMSENLRTRRFNDGTKIQLVPYGVEWSLLQSPGYCWYGNNEAFFSLNHFGALYNGYAANSGNLCPVGWHVPSWDDWVELGSYVGWESGFGKLKEEGTVNWASPNSDATNETGFTALPGGSRGGTGIYGNFRYSALFWSIQSSSFFPLNYYYSTSTAYPSIEMKGGASVRCILDSK
jgi:uncharacterized protein (TIGR02145 family)